MNKHQKNAFRMLNAAKPKSDLRPATKEEWAQLLDANVELGFAMLVECGAPEKEARLIAKQICGGEAGKLILKQAYGAADNE